MAIHQGFHMPQEIQPHVEPKHSVPTLPLELSFTTFVWPSTIGEYSILIVSKYDVDSRTMLTLTFIDWLSSTGIVRHAWQNGVWASILAHGEERSF